MKTIVFDIELEEWLPVPGFEGRYEISNHGRLKSLPFEKQGRNSNGPFSYTTKELIRKPCFDTSGYIWYDLKDGVTRKSHCRKAHRLVAELFIPNPYNRLEVNHKDGDKTNNNVDNLEWCTRKENIKHAFDLGLSSNAGERHPRARLSNNQVKELRKLRESGLSLKEIGETYGVHFSTISKICTGVHFKCVP